MMISPEYFYESEIKGKSVQEIQKKIRSLKREINRLKRVLEDPMQADRERIMPSEATQIWCLRMYLAQAKVGLVEAGGVYEPTKAEQQSDLFDEKISQISKITLLRSGFFKGNDIYQVRFENGSAIWSHDKSFQFILDGETHALEDIIDKDKFLDAFENLHIGEWKRHYYFPCLDGEQWELTVEYGSPKDRFVVDGSNGYPYNFDELASLLRADIYEEE